MNSKLEIVICNKYCIWSSIPCGYARFIQSFLLMPQVLSLLLLLWYNKWFNLYLLLHWISQVKKKKKKPCLGIYTPLLQIIWLSPRRILPKLFALEGLAAVVNRVTCSAPVPGSTLYVHVCHLRSALPAPGLARCPVGREE